MWGLNEEQNLCPIWFFQRHMFYEHLVFPVAYFVMLLKVLMVLVCGKLSPIGPLIGTFHIMNQYELLWTSVSCLQSPKTIFYHAHYRWSGDRRPRYIRHNAAHFSPYSHMVRGTGLQYGFPLPLRWCARHEECSAKFHNNDTSAIWRLYGMTFAEFLH